MGRYSSLPPCSELDSRFNVGTCEALCRPSFTVKVPLENVFGEDAGTHGRPQLLQV